MNTFLMQGLSKLQVDDRVSITYQPQKDETITIQGVVVGTDNASSMAVLPDNEEDPHYLTFDIVKTFRPLQKGLPRKDASPEPPVPAPAEGESGKSDPPAEPPKKSASPQPAILSRNTAEPLHRRALSVLSLNYPDNELKRLFSELPRDEHKVLERNYNSFRDQARVNNIQRMAENARAVSRIIYEEYHNGHLWSQQALRMCGGMLFRSKRASNDNINSACYDPNLFVYEGIELFPEAACFASTMKDYLYAGAYAVIALFDAVPEIERDLLIILAKSIYETRDVSALSMIKERLPLRYESLISPLVQDLLEANEIRVPETMPCDQKISMLAAQYAGQSARADQDDERDMLDIVYEYLNIDPSAADAGDESGEEKAADTPVIKMASYHTPGRFGWITKVAWVAERGEITGNGQTYPFSYQEVQDKDLLNRLKTCYSSELDGSTCWVRFDVANGEARTIITSDSPFKSAKKCADNYDYRGAIDACLCAQGSPDFPEALASIVEYAVMAHGRDRNNLPLVQAAEQIYVDNYDSYPQTAKALSFIAQLYYAMHNYANAIDYMDQALNMRGLPSKMRSSFLYFYVRYCQEYSNETFDPEISASCIERASEWLEIYYANDHFNEDIIEKNFPRVLNWKCHAECLLERLEDAEATLRLLSETQEAAAGLAKREAEVETLRQKIRMQARKAAQRADETTSEPAESADPADDALQPDEPADALPGEEDITDLHGLDDLEPIFFSDLEDEDDTDAAPYDDRDGWPALGITEQAVLDYAFHITGEQAVPYSLTYLRAASRLNPKIRPVYELIALASNDPAHASDYTITGLFNMLDAVGAGCQELNDYCMGTAFLRTSFQADRGYDYSAKSVRDSISILQSNETLSSICDMLETFRAEANTAMDIYADYRNQDVKHLSQAADALVRKAVDLNAKYIEPKQRDSVLYILKTKQIIFARDGYLAQMLRWILDRDQKALEAAKADFVERFLNSSEQISDKNISITKVDKLIADSWEKVGRERQSKRVSGTLQGERRNNIRSNITDILKLICQWYALYEQNAGLSWRNPEGEAVYNRLKPQMIAQLQALHASCEAALADCEPGQRYLGLRVLDHTARELESRLNGEWTFGNEKYMFVDFLKRDDVMLNEDFLPDLSSTFCALPNFNILTRIQAHIEGEKPSFPERIAQIFSPDRFRNNYGSADRIAEYLTAVGEAGAVRLPENAEQYLSQTEQQAQIRYRSFLEIYALAVNYGQIMQSDVYCYTLEDTVKYWYRRAKETHNYGFFNAILHESEIQIHTSAQQYEAMLDEQLDALIENNRAEFDRNPGYETAIREQISQQNFIVAEDWMNRIRVHDFSLVLDQPFALNLLERFWFFYGDIYQHVCDADQPLEQQLILNRHGFSSEKAGQLVHAWIGPDKQMDAAQITEILNLLGWPDIHVEERKADNSDADELYFARQSVKALNKAAPPHPIAAFGSEVTTNGMYVVCLYGSYTADSLYEKIRALDRLQGNKLILLDCAFGVVERHAIAQKLKQRESGIQSVYLILDRVALCFLADSYSEDLVNRNLMAIGIPFSYCMPYVVSSLLTMPPEIFIGRKHELSEIVSPSGVNLIYGGRQLGKSALFKKALGDIDGDQGRRAVLVDIKDCDIASAAAKLSRELAFHQIISPEDETDDWDQLSIALLNSLRRNEDIKYLLIMLDEADFFIGDCGLHSYLPIVKLKDVQQMLPGRFKFVLAGLHNIVRFNRSVALGNNAVITHMPSLKVTPFKTPEAEELLRMPLSFLGMSLPSKVTVSQILATVNYFPGLIQLYAQKLIESLRTSDYAGYDQRKTPPYVITDDHLRRVMADKEFVSQIHEKFEATLKLDIDQGDCYFPIALIFGLLYYEEPTKAKQAGFSAEDVMAQAKGFNVTPITTLDRDRINALLSELEDLNILRSVSENTYLLASKSFRDLLGSYDEIFNQLDSIGRRQP